METLLPFNPHGRQERARLRRVGTHKTGRELYPHKGFPTAPLGCQALGDNATALQWATPRSLTAAAQRQGSGDGHSDIKAAVALKPVLIGPVREPLTLQSQEGEGGLAESGYGDSMFSDAPARRQGEAA